MDTKNKTDAVEALDVSTGYASVTVVVSDSGTPKAVGRNAKEAWGSFDLGYSWRATRRYYLDQGWRTVRYFKHNTQGVTQRGENQQSQSAQKL